MTEMISIIMPALNEEEGVENTIRLIPREEIKKAGFDLEILVIDGGSEDKTVEIAKKLGAKVVLSERGYGKQYLAGFKAAQGDYIVTGDSDGTYPFDNSLKYVYFLIKNKLDFVNINRFANMEKGAMHFSNKIGNKGLTFFTNVLFGLRIKDSQSGMWVFKKSCLNNLELKSAGMSFSQEIKIEAFKKLKSAEISGNYKKRLGETKLLKFKDGFGNLKHLFDNRLKF